MYRCEICHEVSKPGQAQLRHVVYRPRPKSPWNPEEGQEIAREVAVCPVCSHDLSTKETLSDLTAAHAYTRVARRERERQRRAERKALDLELLRQPREPLLRGKTLKTAVELKTTEPEPSSSVPAPARKLGRSVRRAQSAQ